MRLWVLLGMSVGEENSLSRHDLGCISCCTCSKLSSGVSIITSSCAIFRRSATFSMDAWVSGSVSGASSAIFSALAFSRSTEAYFMEIASRSWVILARFPSYCSSSSKASSWAASSSSSSCSGPALSVFIFCDVVLSSPVQWGPGVPHWCFSKNVLQPEHFGFLLKLTSLASVMVELKLFGCRNRLLG